MTDVKFESMLKSSLFRAAELDYLESIPTEEELRSLVTPSIKFERKMSKLTANAKAYLRKLRMPVYQKVLRAAAAALLIISTLAGISMFNPDVRAMVINFVRIWFSDRTRYEVTDSVDSIIPDSVTLGYVPDGFELDFELYDSFGANLVYGSDNNDYFDIAITGKTGRPHIDNEHSEFYSVVVGERIVDVYESNNMDYPSILVSFDDDKALMTIITGTINVDELISVLEGISF